MLPVLSIVYAERVGIWVNFSTSAARAPAPPAISPRPQEVKPTFINSLTNQPLQFGATAYFECKVHGYPPPEILWTRRGHPLVDKTRYKSTYDQYNGITTLTILDLQEADEGQYEMRFLSSFVFYIKMICMGLS